MYFSLFTMVACFCILHTLEEACLLSIYDLSLHVCLDWQLRVVEVVVVVVVAAAGGGGGDGGGAVAGAPVALPVALPVAPALLLFFLLLLHALSAL